MEKQTSNLNNGASKVKLLCSFGGRIWSRPTDRQLSYIGGDTKILAVDRHIKLSDIIAKLNSICQFGGNSDISIKYQLPGEDLDALVSLIDDDDVEHMMLEYDRLQRVSSKPARLRLFIFDVSGSLSVSGATVKSEPAPAPVTHLNPDYLFGFDKEYQPSIGPPLDLLQIPGIVLPENYGLVPCGGVEGYKGMPECHVANRSMDVTENEAVYQVQAVVGGGGVYKDRPYAFGVMPAGGGGEQPVYSFVPVMPSVHRPGI